MNRRFGTTTAAIFLAGVCATTGGAQQKTKKDVHWPSFRGANAMGIAEGFPTPTKWNVEKKENILWKTPIPGLSHSSPIVWGNRLFVTTALSANPNSDLKVGLYGDVAPSTDEAPHTWSVYCLDKRTGKILWQKVAHKGVPKVKRHTKATQANCTMATDGKHLLAFFGAEGLYCYDLNGNLLWKKDLGVLDAGWYVMPSAQFGFASSPIIHGNRVLVQCDVQKNPFLAAFDIRTGSELWRTVRDDTPTWSTPTITSEGGRTQMIVNGWKHIGGYDVQTGKELWKLKGGGDLPVPTPVVSHGLIFVANAHGRMAPLYAIRANAKGDISLKDDETTNEGIAWSERRNGAYMQTPLVYGDYVYSCRDNGVLSCYEVTTGKRLYQQRMGSGFSGFTASPVASNGKLYFTGEEGDIYVVKAGPEFQVLGTNPMGEVCMATPAISEGMLFFRTQHHLIAVGEKSKP